MSVMTISNNCGVVRKMLKTYPGFNFSTQSREKIVFYSYYIYSSINYKTPGYKKHYGLA